ncbi:holin [Streptomyces bohaiensis]|uniref:holin n=1 Tax=Streptomyces bohaiensis TaxID=1431344 RepID=UPI003B7715F4
MNTTFWRATGERAVRTFAQALAAILGAGAVDLLSVDWPGALAAAGLAAVLSVLTAVGSAGVGQHGPGVTESALPSPRSLRAARDRDAAG